MTCHCGCGNPRPLSAPAAHSLLDCLADLRFGRPAAEQVFLAKVSEIVRVHGITGRAIDEIAREADDPANWWKRGEEGA